ncbi:MAG: HEPN domain-containing protein [Acidobacteria bacterium]|jgi:HEPN domain-containing protein|nr:HEPN domain-containing protein [Acidobacteriota bacterium]
MSAGIEGARVLAQKAENDWKNASSGLAHDVPLDTVCFHIQQTAEKLLKALLAARGIEYPLTHDLRDLLKLALSEFPALEEFRSRLPEYTFFAVAVRYESPEPELEEALEAYETVKRFREIAHSLLPPEARP